MKIKIALAAFACSGILVAHLPTSASAAPLTGVGQSHGATTADNPLNVALVLLFAAIFAATFFFSCVSDHLISLPNKAYWPAPERREATLLYVLAWLRWFLVLTLAFIMLVVGLTLRANMHTPPQLSVAAPGMLINLWSLPSSCACTDQLKLLRRTTESPELSATVARWGTRTVMGVVGAPS